MSEQQGSARKNTSRLLLLLCLWSAAFAWRLWTDLHPPRPVLTHWRQFFDLFLLPALVVVYGFSYFWERRRKKVTE